MKGFVWPKGKPRKGFVIVQGKKKRFYYKRGEPRRHIEKYFYIHPIKKMAKKLGKSVDYVDHALMLMRRMGVIPSKKEIILEYFKRMKSGTRTRRSVAASLGVSERFASEIAKKMGKEFKKIPRVSAYEKRRPYYFSAIGRISQEQMSRELPLDRSKVSKEARRAKKEMRLRRMRRKQKQKK